MEHYRNCKKAYLGIDNIHVMRSSLAAVDEGGSRIPYTSFFSQADRPCNLQR